jgi:hypothetical protein
MSNNPNTNYSWSSESAMKKAIADLSISVNVGPVSVSKTITGPHDPLKDAYKACKHCGKHLNYHVGGKCV